LLALLTSAGLAHAQQQIDASDGFALPPTSEAPMVRGDNAAVTAMLDRLLHHSHVLKCGPKSWRTHRRTSLLATEAVL
jgi:hypothetical protein